MKSRFHTMRTTGTYVTTTTLGEAVQAFVPHPLPPAEPPLAPASYTPAAHRAELALARLSGSLRFQPERYEITVRNSRLDHLPRPQ